MDYAKQKQTAVNYLIHSINEDMFQLSKSEAEWKEVFKKAKAIEKEQIMDAFGVGCQVDRDYLYGYHAKAEQYYNETYGK